MIDRPIPGVVTVVKPHPAGAEGAHVSLKEVAERAWKARTSPRIRAWAMQAMAAAGASEGTRAQKGQAILDAFRKKVPYVADPVHGEFMAKPEQTLCLDEGGLCLIGGDCDDMSIALAALMMSIGINAMIIGSSHREPAGTPTHVFMAFESETGDWLRMDGTTKLPVGKAPPRIKEFWVEPGEEAKEAGAGDFVGMAGAPSPASAVNNLGLAAPSIRHNLLYPGIR